MRKPFALPLPVKFPGLNPLMRSWIKSGVTWGSLTLGAWLATLAPGWSLTPDQLAEKLGAVPVFTIGIVEENSVTFLEEPIKTNEGAEVSISRIYMNPQDAQADLEQIRTDNPTLPTNVSVARISLGEIYCLTQAEQGCTQQPTPSTEVPSFIYFPDRGQLGAAIDLLKQQGTEVSDNTPLFVPLFFAQVQVNPDRTTTVPIIYFSLTDLRCDIAQAQAENTQLKDAKFDVQVTTLGQVIQQLQSPENANATEVRFVPLQRPADGSCTAGAAAPSGGSATP